VYDALPEAELVGVADVDDEAAATVADEYGVANLDRAELLDRVEAVSIAVPTEYHFETAMAAFDAETAVLVEKPICRSVDRARELVDRADEVGVTLQVGHIERFNPAVATTTEVIDDIDELIAINAERLGPPISREITDSVVLDLMIHDIDVVCSLVGAEPSSIDASATREGQYATATLEFPSGVVATLTTSRVTQRKVRSLDITADDRLVTADFLDRGVEIHRHSLPEYVQTDGDVRYRHESIVEYPTIERGEPLRKELASFLEAVTTETEPVVSGGDGVRALRIAKRIEAEAGIDPQRVHSALAAEGGGNQ
jgi:predicted dehydrogenase